MQSERDKRLRVWLILTFVLAIVLSSGGSGQVEVAAFQGKTRAQAVRLAEVVGLHPVFLVRESGDPPGTVIRQRPQAGTEVLAGSDVILVVSKGTAPTAAPPPSGNPGGEGHHHKGKGKGYKGKGKGKGNH